MAVVEMRKLSLTVHDSSRGKLITDLQKSGCVHLSQSEEPQPDDEAGTGLTPIPVDVEDLDSLIAELEDSIHFIESQVPAPKKSFLTQISELPPSVTYLKMEEVYKKFNLTMNLREIKTIEKKFKDAQTKLNVLLKEKEDLLQWNEAGIDLDVLNGKSQFVEGLTGYIPKALEVSIMESIIKISPYVEVFKSFETTSDTFLYIVFLKSEKSAVMDALRDLGFAPMTLSSRTGTVTQALDAIDDEIVIVSGNIEIYRSFIIDYSDYLDKFRIIFDYLLIRKERLDAERKGVKTSAVSFYTGWFPIKHEKEIRDTLSQYDDIDYIIAAPTDEDAENVPVMLNNSPFAKPYETITTMYGLPLYGNSFDPTAHLTPFYFVFFGICLADFFYGLILLLLFGFLAIKSRKNPGMSRFMSLLALGGLSSMIFGVLLGSFFGDLFTVYVRVDFIAGTGLINAMKSPMLVLYFALIFGAVHLLYGITLKFITMLKKNVIEAIFEKFSWIVFLSGFFGWAVFSWMTDMVNQSMIKAVVEPGNLITSVPTLNALGMNIISGLMITGAVMIMVNSFRKGKKTIMGFIGSLFGGIYSLYGTSAFVSDILSYARLLALGLSGSIIANVFNLLSFMLRDSIGGIAGTVVTVLFLIVGHVFNLVLSSFGAFVHSLRLQFVEFFSKFLESGGTPYEPLREEGVYYRVTPANEVK
jgi:V/A-type H+-transporting ATPase subunit I